jgi:hypothetical protein
MRYLYALLGVPTSMPFLHVKEAQEYLSEYLEVSLLQAEPGQRSWARSSTNVDIYQSSSERLRNNFRIGPKLLTKVI